MLASDILQTIFLPPRRRAGGLELGPGDTQGEDVTRDEADREEREWVAREEACE